MGGKRERRGEIHIAPSHSFFELSCKKNTMGKRNDNYALGGKKTNKSTIKRILVIYKFMN